MRPQTDPDPDLDPGACRRHLLVLAAATWAAGLAGCATRGVAPTPAPTPPPAPIDSPPAAASPLAIERQWLQQWFKGTPVHIVQDADGELSVDVPLEFSFDAGRSAVKPALAAVLDKVAESLRRVQRARLVLVAAPQDSGATAVASLAQQRAAAVRRHLTMRGIANSRMAAASAATSPAVQLRLRMIDAAAG
jgi:outer membrane protein OmpA-like peptidoglycan-associated protein